MMPGHLWIAEGEQITILEHPTPIDPIRSTDADLEAPFDHVDEIVSGRRMPVPIESEEEVFLTLMARCHPGK